MRLSGAGILIEELISQGVDTIFGYPGGAVLTIYDELYRSRDRIRHVITAHEQGACHAADGYARASGKTGVVLATSGPGATNLVTGIANAYLDSVPLLAITGNVSVDALGRDSFQEVDIVGITQPVVKHSFMVRDVTELEQTIKEAFLIANSGRKGPVLIDIPKDVQTGSCEYGIAVVPRMPEKPKLPYDKEAVLAALSGAERPFLYCGGGVISSGAEEEILSLSKRIDAPIGLSMMGRSAVPDSYSYNLGMCGMHGNFAASRAQSECDLLLAAGVRFSDRATGDISEYTKNRTIIHIDIDKAEIGKNVRPGLSLQGDVKEILQDLLRELPEKKHPDWRRRVEGFREWHPRERKGEFCPENIIRALRRHTEDETIIATDVGQHQIWTMQYYAFERPRTLLSSGGLGTMGYGLGAAVGGCIASGGRRTVLITSEGSFGMNLNELCTVVSQKLPITVLILDNQVLGMVRQWQGMFYGKRYSETTLDQRRTDFAALARAFGAKGYSVSDLEGLEEALKEMDGNEEDAILIDCHIDRDEQVLPMIPPGKSIRDIILPLPAGEEAPLEEALSEEEK